MGNELEHRSFLCEIRAKENEGNESVLIGRPIVYESKTDICGWFEEVIAKGALDKADLKDVRFLVNHDLSKIPLARSRNNNGNSTMKLDPNENGLDVEVKLDTENNADARALFSAVKRGDISGMSFMFSVRDEEWKDVDSDYPTRIIKAIKDVVEVSACTFPAYNETEISTRSSNKNEVLDSARLALDNARSKRNKSLDNDNDLDLLKAKFNFLLEMED